MRMINSTDPQRHIVNNIFITLVSVAEFGYWSYTTMHFPDVYDINIYVTFISFAVISFKRMI